MLRVIKVALQNEKSILPVGVEWQRYAGLKADLESE
jgi:hypothetical protein